MTSRFYPALMYYENRKHVCRAVDFEVESNADTYFEARQFAESALQLDIDLMDASMLPYPTSPDRMVFMVHEMKAAGWILLQVKVDISSDIDFSEEKKDDHTKSNTEKRGTPRKRKRW